MSVDQVVPLGIGCVVGLLTAWALTNDSIKTHREYLRLIHQCEVSLPRSKNCKMSVVEVAQ